MDFVTYVRRLYGCQYLTNGLLAFRGCARACVYSSPFTTTARPMSRELCMYGSAAHPPCKSTDPIRLRRTP